MCTREVSVWSSHARHGVSLVSWERGDLEELRGDLEELLLPTNPHFFKGKNRREAETLRVCGGPVRPTKYMFVFPNDSCNISPAMLPFSSSGRRRSKSSQRARQIPQKVIFLISPRIPPDTHTSTFHDGTTQGNGGETVNCDIGEVCLVPQYSHTLTSCVITCR